MSKSNKNSNKFVIYWTDENDISELFDSLEQARKEVEEVLDNNEGELTVEDAIIYEICASYYPKSRGVELVKHNKIAE